MKRIAHKILHVISNRIGSKITVQLLIIFFTCTLVSIAFFNVSMFFVRRAIEEHEQRAERMVVDGYKLSLAMQNENVDAVDTEKIDLLINSTLEGKLYRIALTDQRGNTLYSSSDEEVDNSPIIITMQDDTEENTTIARDMDIYPIKLDDTIVQLVVTSYEEPGWIVKYNRNGMIPGLTALVSIIIFIILFILLTKKKISYITEIASCVKIISMGNLGYRVGVRGNNELTLLAKELNYMTCELNSYFEREKNLERSKTELMMSVSHDLKSPLTAVIGYLSLLKDMEHEKDAVMADYVERAYQKALRIKELQEELLDFASLSSEDIRLNKQTISLSYLLEQLIGEYTSIVKENEIQIIADLSNENLYVDVDPNYIVRVFENLLSNSFRYSPKQGEIRIALENRDGSFFFSITNESERIEQEELERMFDRFYRCEKSRSEETGGTGLGLASAKRITELHGGKIWAEYVNKKITFRVMLPAKA